jgi:hypothetical protein
MHFLKFGLVAMSGLYIYATGAAATTAQQQQDALIKTTLVDDIGASERVEAAGLLRVLSQEVASAACHMAAGIDPDQSQKLLIETKTRFTEILDALQYGNPRMNIIGAEERRKTVVKIENLRTQWLPVKAAAVSLLDRGDDAEALNLIKAENEAILASTFDLTSELAGQYSNPAELLQSDVMLLDFAGRQALLTQKMAKIACQIWSGNRGEDRLALLSSTMQTYDLTLTALHDGMPAVGLLAAPTPEIGAALTKARSDWSVIKGKLDALIAAETFEDERKAELYSFLNIAMYDMEKIEKLYVTHSKHDYN